LLIKIAVLLSVFFFSFNGDKFFELFSVFYTKIIIEFYIFILFL